jgi:tripartite-type tricarboxylate transporter receptor subunit TctC
MNRFIVAIALLCLSFPVTAQKQLRIIVPFPPGGAADALARMLAEKLPAQLGQPVLVENRPGAGGNVAAKQLSRAETWMGLVAPPGTPRALAGRQSTAVARVLEPSAGPASFKPPT